MRESGLVGVDDGVGWTVAVVVIADPDAPLSGVTVSQVPTVIAMTQPAHRVALAAVQVNTSPPTATLRTMSMWNVVESGIAVTDAEPAGRAVGTSPLPLHPTPMRRSPATNPAGMTGVNVVDVPVPELPTPVDRTVAVMTGTR